MIYLSILNKGSLASPIIFNNLLFSLVKDLFVIEWIESIEFKKKIPLLEE